MELVRVTAPLASRHQVAGLARDHAVLFECSDADTVVVAASLVGETTAPVGVWLTVGLAYPAQLAARDVATLSRILDLRDVVVAAEAKVVEHLEVLRALLSDDEVDFANDVAVLRSAFNRPAPPGPLRLWAYGASQLVGDDDTLTLARTDSRDGVQLTFFSSW